MTSKKLLGILLTSIGGCLGMTIGMLLLEALIF